jgi:hypothetical protein
MVNKVVGETKKVGVSGEKMKFKSIKMTNLLGT